MSGIGGILIGPKMRYPSSSFDSDLEAVTRRTNARVEMCLGDVQARFGFTRNPGHRISVRDYLFRLYLRNSLLWRGLRNFDFWPGNNEFASIASADAIFACRSSSII